MGNVVYAQKPLEQASMISRIYEAQKKNRWNISKTTAKERIQKLKKLKTALLEQRPKLQNALFEDFQKNAAEADLTEIYPVIAEINHTIKHLSRWMKPTSVKTPMAMFGTASKILCEAKGLVLILSPWNYPINLSLCPVIAAVAAGNCVILKPSSKVSNTAEALSELLRLVFPENEVAVAQGSSEISNALLEMKFDHIFFTGSPRIGKAVMRAAAANLTPVTLELGGKSPAIVDATAHIEQAAQRIMWGKFLNAGQTCIAPDYLLIHKSKLNAFMKASKRILSERYGEDKEARHTSDSFCRLVSVSHCEHVKKLLDDSVSQGAKILFGGSCNTTERYLEPTLLVDVEPSFPVMQEEIFAPILPVMTFETLDECITLIQHMEKPLALYLFTRSKQTREHIISNTTSGGTCINTTILHVANPDLPFGGVGQSGMGSYHGLHGFENLSHKRAVLTQKAPDMLKMFYPPYTERVKKLIWLMTRYLS